MAAEAANSKSELSETLGADVGDSLTNDDFSMTLVSDTPSQTSSAKALLQRRRVSVRMTSEAPESPVVKAASVEARFRAEVLEFLAKLDEKLDKLTSKVERFPSSIPSKSSSYVEDSLIDAWKKDDRQVEFGTITWEENTNAHRLPEGTGFTDVPDCPDVHGSGAEAVPSCSVPSNSKKLRFLLSEDLLQEKEVHLEHDSWSDELQAPVSEPLDGDCRLHGNSDQQLVPYAEAVEFPTRAESKVRPSSSSDSVVRSAMRMMHQKSMTLDLSMSRKTRTRTVVEKKLWSFLEDPDGNSGGRHFTRLMCLAILCGTAIPVLQTIRPPPFDVFMMGMVGAALDFVFSLEVAFRFWACPNRMFFFLNGFNIIDLIASVCPLLALTATGGRISLHEAAMNENYWLMILICSIPILRLLKLLRRFETFHLFLLSFRMALEAMPVLIYNLVVLVLLFSSIIYIAEPKDGIDTFSRALWFTIVTVGTVGYGDVTLQSTAGTIAAAMLIIVSALYMAIPLGIVGKAFGSVWDDRDRLLLMHRTRLRFLSGGYRAQDIPEMFFSFDVDHNGSLSLPEFMDMMRQMEIDVSRWRVLRLFKAFDEDGSGGIDDREFVRTLFPNAYTELYGADADAEENTPSYAY
ncbi:unnamed protein product [Polarella glacialis]|uniref:EF-hand domain-containing protein n=1 Tax=Polarella glacialis TaxID=89957 RepID=A0A813GGV0_POLGL|nr:unnamed protein product [Polarella glacialis]CAE8703679.1 unnamed protein product [Polarella glacialis]